MRLSLAAKITLALVGVLVLTLLSSVIAIVSAHRFESLQKTLVDDNLASVRAAEELEIALLVQRGYVSSYILDNGNRVWLTRLHEQRGDFDYWLAAARKTARSDDERQILDRLATVQSQYAQKREDVVAQFDKGQVEEAKELLLRQVAAIYQQSYDLCEQFIDVNQRLVDATSADVRRQVERVTVVVTATLIITLVLATALLWLFFQGVLSPLRRISANARLASGDESIETGTLQRDELRELGHYVQLLMANVAETRLDLEHSREQLASAEKLAAVGKLAASVAHEIRNPLTSMKMWLYSLRRSLEPDDRNRQKLDVVSDEIARLDNIVRHFLEFSRPPPLKIGRHDIGQILDKTLDLVACRLQQRQIRLARPDKPDTSPVMADAEQLQQVLVNLINNAVEAMPQGGEIRVSAVPATLGERDMVAVRVADSGPGIPAEVQERVFEPFFTTKPEGTGLGLCIAASIMAGHGGALKLEASDSHGTRWAVFIPRA